MNTNNFCETIKHARDDLNPIFVFCPNYPTAIFLTIFVLFTKLLDMLLIGAYPKRKVCSQYFAYFFLFLFDYIYLLYLKYIQFMIYSKAFFFLELSSSHFFKND